MTAPTNTTCTPARLLEHADAIDHAAARGGYIDDRTGQRVPLAEPARARWAHFAALLRGAAHQQQGDCSD